MLAWKCSCMTFQNDDCAQVIVQTPWEFEKCIQSYMFIGHVAVERQSCEKPE